MHTNSAEELITSNGGTVMTAAGRSATHCVYGPGKTTGWGQKSGKGSSKYKDCNKYKCTMWEPDAPLQIVEDAPLILAQQRLAFAALCSEHHCAHVSVNAHVQQYIQDALPGIAPATTVQAAWKQTWSWRDGGKAEQARVDAIAEQEQAKCAAAEAKKQKQLDKKT